MNSSNIVIKRRLPLFSILDQFLCYTAILIEYFQGPCVIFHGVVVVCFLITFIRTTYVYEFLSLQKCVLRYINYVFWNNHILRIIPSLLIVSLFLALSTLTVMLYSNVTNFSSTCNLYPWFIIYTELYFLMAFEFVYVLFILSHKIKDNIGMSIEITGRSISSLFILLILQVLGLHYNLEFIYFAMIQGCSFIFWSTWFPLLYILHIRIHRPHTMRLSGCDYNLHSLEVVGRLYFCNENILFLKKYDEFLENDRDSLFLDDIISRFVEISAKHQLNLSQELRNRVILFPGDIDLVYVEVSELVKHNLLPFMG